MRRTGSALAAGALVLATAAACGGSGGEDASPDESPGATAESPTGDTAASSEPPSEPADDATGGAGDCGEEIQELEGAEGVTLTVPADWSVETFGDGENVRYAGPDGDTVEGDLIVQSTGQTIDEGVSDAERLNSQSEKTGDQEIDLPGFDAARQLSFESSLASNTTVVAVAGDLRVIAYAIVEDSPEDLTLATGCMLTLSR